MSSEQTQADPVVVEEEEKLTERQAAELAERAQFAQTGDVLDTGMGNQGGMGASSTGPDISEQSKPMPGNSSDLPKP